MAVLRLAICSLGVYACFILWAIAQERLSSVPFPSIYPGEEPRRFKFILFTNACQSIASATFALIYLFVRRNTHTQKTFFQIVGLEPPSSPSAEKKAAVIVGKGNTKRRLLLRYLQVASFNTLAAPFGFASLSHISYPTMVLGKSCKLVPVLFMNVLLYRRKFPPYKYLVVALVTLGISLFMFFGKEGGASKKSSAGGNSSMKGIALLLVNLLIDGATNSTQDEIFHKFKVSGQQMMFMMSNFSLLLTLPFVVIPNLPHIPILHPNPSAISEFQSAILFINSHPDVIRPLVVYGLTGALGQLFIFETLQHFGSLTLVTLTVTRKLMTMLLSVVVFNHSLYGGQWLGAATVFFGIGIEAYAKFTEGKHKKKKDVK